MRVITLGTGAGRPTLKRHSSATALEYQGQIFLFDCGEGTQLQLMKTPLHWGRMGIIFISHLHGDHVNGLPGLLGTLSLSDRTEPLTVYGPRGLGKLLQAHQDCQTMALRFELTLVEIEGPGLLFETGSYQVTTRPLNHVLNCWGYRFEEKELRGRFDGERADQEGIPNGPLRARLIEGEDIELPDGRKFYSKDFVGPKRPGRIFVHCLDTRPCEAAIQLSKNADLLLHEATFSHEVASEAHRYGHSTPVDAAQCAKEAGVKNLILTHISQRYQGGEELLQEAQEVFPSVRLASDLEEFEIPSP